MSSRYGQVALLYVRHAVSGYQTALVAALALAGVAAFPWVQLRDDAVQFHLLTLFAVALVLANLKRQLVVVRAGRWPHAFWPHLLIGGTLASVLVIGMPLLVWWCQPTPLWGRAAYMMTLTVMVAWCSVRPAYLLLFPTLVVFYLPLSWRTEPYLRDFLTGRHETLALGILVGASLAYVGLLRWLACLHEEQRHYHTNLAGSAGAQAAAADEQAKSASASWLGLGRWFEPSPQRMAWWPDRAQGNAWVRAGMLRIGLSKRSLGALVVILAFSVFWFGWMYFAPDRPPSSPVVWIVPSFMMGLWLTILPLALVAVPLSKADHLLLRTWLTPLDRRRWVQMWGLGLLQMLYLGVMCSWLVVLIVGPGAVNHVVFAALLLRYVPISLAASLLLFGVVTWSLAWAVHGHAGQVLAFFLTYSVGMGIAVLTAMTAISPTQLLGWALLIVLLGGLLTCAAYRRWLNVELGAG